MNRFAITIGLCLVTLAMGCGGNSSPTTPTPPAQTRTISISGSLNFGRVGVGTSTSQSININNTGNSPMTVTGISGPCGASFRATWTNGVIPGPGTQNTTVTFAPTAPQDCSGTLTVAADFTSGTNTFPVVAIGTLDGVPIFTRVGSGDTVFDLPSYVTRIRITADYTAFTSNFIVRIGGRLVVNELVGTAYNQTHFDGTYAISGGTVEITNSSGVRWSFTEVR
jgi:hypothetical protein